MRAYCRFYVIFAAQKGGMFGWFKKKSRKSELEEEKSRQLLEWKHKFFDVLTILADMFPDGMAMLLEELDIHHPPSYDKTEWYLSIWNNHNYILQNIHRLPRLNVRRGILTGFEVPVPDVVLNKVTMLRKMVDGWETNSMGRPFYALEDYCPTRIKTASPEVWNVRKLVWNFKCDVVKVSPIEHAQAMEQVLDRLAVVLQDTFGEHVSKLTFVCIPASSMMAHHVRYAEFAERLCKRTGMVNAHGRITVRGEKTPTHIGKGGSAGVEMDKEWFKYRSVLFFDDVITTGSNYDFLSFMMIGARAFTIGAVFIAHTVSDNR